MRKVAIAVAVFLLIASAAAAQQKNELSVFASHGAGIAYGYMFTPQISAQLAVAQESHRSYPYVVSPTGAFVPVPSVRFRTHPIDLSVRYHWINETRWKPFLGIGARYVAAPDVKVDTNVVRGFGYKNHFGPEIVGGTFFRITRSFGLLMDGRAYFGDREPYDDPFKASIGLAWRF